ncbi:AraC family transcriptional regulator [Microbacterium sp. cx-59]|uniref:AraC family transcriptional regulator n=1 Tax=Microbacterium sp. cx-59 TaxID=2891207 RepID=UPI001E50938E|nr:AraC family transcriptional regulator [Microbacterium sp. cx-59]MCC4909434.1 AraC family transcriptional regulator [Microbacterium sp. cx-59]
MAMREAAIGARVVGTTRGLPPGRDFDYFCDAVADVYVGIRPQRSASFAADFSLYDIGPFSLGLISTPGVSASRDRASLRRVSDDAVFVNQSSGAWGLAQGGATWHVGAGALVLDNDAPFTVIADPRRRLRLASVRIPRAMLSRRAGSMIALLDDRLAGTPLGAQVSAQVELLTSAARNGMVRVAEVMAVSVLEMLEAACAAEPALPGRRDAMRAYALSRVGDARLDLTAMARAFGCSTRTVQTEFAAEGETFSTWLRSVRLDRAREALRGPDDRGRSIRSVAAECGFADVGTFHRAYRARFGRTPASDR